MRSIPIRTAFIFAALAMLPFLQGCTIEYDYGPGGYGYHYDPYRGPYWNNHHGWWYWGDDHYHFGPGRWSGYPGIHFRFISSSDQPISPMAVTAERNQPVSSIDALARDFSISPAAAEKIIGFLHKKNRGKILKELQLTETDFAPMLEQKLPNPPVIEKIGRALHEDPMKIYQIMKVFVADIKQIQKQHP